MARTGITREQVFEAASQLKAQGMQITMQRIREALGETGSFTTISRLLEEWRAADTIKDREVLPDIPEAAEQGMQAAIRELWRIAAATAHRRVAEAKEEADRRVKEAEGRYGEARAEVERLEKAAAAADDEVQTLRIRAGQLERDLSAAQAVEGELRERVASEEARSRELEAKVGELGAAAADLQKKAQAAEVREREREAESRRLGRELEEVGRRAQASDEARARAESEAQAAAERAAASAANVIDLEKQLGATRAAEAELRDRVKAEAERNKALEDRMGELNKELLRLAAARDAPSKKS